MAIQAKPTVCPYCDGRNIIKKGLRQNHFRRNQLYQCKSCWKYFSPATISGTKYPPYLIFKALSLYYQGYSQTEVSALLSSRHRFSVPRRTISEWTARYQSVCTFGRLREKAKKLYSPDQMIQSATLEHRQVYIYKLHRAKLDLLTDAVPARTLGRLRTYLESIATAAFPHHLFVEREGENGAARSSQLHLETLPPGTIEKLNLANDLALLGLVLARTNRDRHPSVEDFMLATDSTTVACEVPLYLTEEELAYFRSQGFSLSYPTLSVPITGHIDLLQVRNGLIHILDYKPEAHKVTPIAQLVTYALALASRTRLPLSAFKCAWFDEKHYYEFFPLHAVYPKK